MYTSPSEDDVSTLEQVIGSWFIVGKLGGYNSANLQVRAPVCHCRLFSAPSNTVSEHPQPRTLV